MNHLKANILGLALLCCLPMGAQMKWNQTYQTYINQYKDLAIEQMLRYRIPASITLAQGLFESAAGRSDLVRQGNNHFGIKCHNWTGPTQYHDDDARGECFRVYQELGLKIVTYMRDRANEFSEQYHHNYSILATPAEGLSGKFTKKDRKQFGVIPGVTDRDYYTNSNHVPVYYKCTALKKAQVEAPYHDLTRGGHIFYVEIDGDATHNPSVIESVVDMMDKYNMGYGSVNHNRNRCLDCGYENADAHLEVCPKCGSHHIDKLQRITGYLVGTTDRWNSGKLAELHDRVTHIGGEK